MQAKEFKTIGLQLRLFTPHLIFFKNKILQILISNFGDILAGDTITLPTLKDAPSDMPQLILPSADNTFKLEIALGGIGFFRSLADGKTGIDEIDENQFLKVCLDISKKYLDCTSAKVGRLAIVTTRYLEKEKPGLEISQYFCRNELTSGPLNRPENFEIHAHKKYGVNDFIINSWFRCKSGFLQKQENKPIIVVEQDINTLHEEIEQNDFTVDAIKHFTELITKEQRSILNKYFPNNA